MLEADLVALMARLAGSRLPLDRLGDWYELHAEEVRGAGARVELRVAVQEALAVARSLRLRRLTDRTARAQLGRLAILLAAAVAPAPGGPDAGPVAPAGSGQGPARRDPRA